MTEIPEFVRDNIKSMIDESTKGLTFENTRNAEIIRHMITQISLEMYKAGWKDAHRLMRKAIDINQDVFMGKESHD